MVGGTRYLLLGRRPSPPGERERLDRFGALHGLSPAELRLCLELAADRTLNDAAERLGMTRHTARDRLKTVFCKTGVSRQGALVSAILLS